MNFHCCGGGHCWRSRCDETGYRKYTKDYAALADSLDFEARMARAASSWPAGNVG
jgi:hypothetical protein